MNRATYFKFCTDIEDGPLRRVHLKVTPNFLSERGPSHLTLFQNFGTHITGKTAKVNYMYIKDNKTANIKGKN